MRTRERKDRQLILTVLNIETIEKNCDLQFVNSDDKIKENYSIGKAYKTVLSNRIPVTGEDRSIGERWHAQGQRYIPR